MRARRAGLAAVVVAALLAPACIDVGDYGPFWDAQALDAELAGRWVSVRTRAGDPGEMEFIRRDTAYAVLTRDGVEPAKEAEEQVRTVRVGASRFLMTRVAGKSGGFMTGYRIARGRLEILDLPVVAAGADLPAPPPSVRYTGTPGAPASVEIARLDQAALDWLGRVAARSQASSVFARRR